jgi:hypothetical protein
LSNLIKPKLTLFGNAPSEHLGYGAWNYRSLALITSNQAGNIVLEIGDGFIDVFVENDRFATACRRNPGFTNSQGYVFLDRIVQHAEVNAA